MAPVYLNTRTGRVVDYPENIGRHPVLGRHLVPHVEGAPEAEAAIDEAPPADEKTSRKTGRRDKTNDTDLDAHAPEHDTEG